MNKLNEKELQIIINALTTEREISYDNAYLEYKRNNIKRAEEIEEYTKQIEKVLKKLYE